MAERTGIRSRKRDVLKWVTGATAVLSLFFAVRQFRRSRDRQALVLEDDAHLAGERAERVVVQRNRGPSISEPRTSVHVPHWLVEFQFN